MEDTNDGPSSLTLAVVGWLSNYWKYGCFNDYVWMRANCARYMDVFFWS
jgi:hypothetical protein